MADPVVNVATGTNTIKIIQDTDDTVTISETTVVERNEVKLVSSNEVPNLSYIINKSPPTSSSAAGTLGELRFDTDYLYVCVSANSWKRLNLSSF